jgi:hypothetical protein
MMTCYSILVPFNLCTLLPKDLNDDEVKGRLLKFEDLIDQAFKKSVRYHMN